MAILLAAGVPYDDGFDSRSVAAIVPLLVGLAGIARCGWGLTKEERRNRGERRDH